MLCQSGIAISGRENISYEATWMSILYVENLTINPWIYTQPMLNQFQTSPGDYQDFSPLAIEQTGLFKEFCKKKDEEQEK